MCDFWRNRNIISDLFYKNNKRKTKEARTASPVFPSPQKMTEGSAGGGRRSGRDKYFLSAHKYVWIPWRAMGRGSVTPKTTRHFFFILEICNYNKCVPTGVEMEKGIFHWVNHLLFAISHKKGQKLEPYQLSGRGTISEDRYIKGFREKGRKFRDLYCEHT